MTWAMRLMLLSTGARFAPDAPPGAGAEPPPGDDDNDAEDPPPPGTDTPPPARQPSAEPAIVNNDGQERQRPKDLPEQFWDPQKGSIRLESLIKSYNDTKSKVGEKEEAARARLRDELMAELAPGDLPAKPEDYALSEDMAKMIQGDDPLLSAFRVAAHEAKIAPAAFNAIVQGVLKSMPPPDPAKEKAALGDNADTRIERVSKYVARHVKDPALAKQAEALATTADGVRLIETLIGVQASTERVGNDGSTGPSTAPSWAEVKTAMADDRYQPGPLQDPSYIAIVDQMKERHFSARGAKRSASSGL